MNEIERQMDIDLKGTMEDLANIIRRQRKAIAFAVIALKEISRDNEPCGACDDNAVLARLALDNIRRANEI